MKQDWFYLIMLICVGIVQILDAMFTYVGVKSGFLEGNPIARILFSIFGLKLALIIMSITVIVILGSFYIYYINRIEGSERLIPFIYSITFCTLLMRVFVIGIWFGILGMEWGHFR